MSDTPETDNHLEATKIAPGANLWASADFARKLERERDEARKERNAALSDRDAWARMCGAVDCYTPSTAEPYEALKLQRDELRAEVERMKADKARLDWLIEHGANDFFEVLSEYPSQARNAIDAAMKGDAL